MQPTRHLNAAERFFWNNAGWSYDPRKETQARGRTLCAKAMADAEQAYQDAEAYANWCFKIVPDELATFDEGAPRWLMYIEDTQGHVMASLGAVDDDSKDYSRVIRAELSLELVEELKAAAAAERGD